MKSIALPLRVAVQTLTAGIALYAPSVQAQANSLLRIHTIEVAPGSQRQFVFSDQGTGVTNYIVEFAPGLGDGSSWSNVLGTVITDLGGGNFRVVAPSSQTPSAFYRIRGHGSSVTASFVSTAFQVLEGGMVSATIRFNAPFVGTIRYTVSGTAASGDYEPLSGEVLVNGTTAVIPVSLTENGSIGEIRNLTLRLESGTGYRVGTSPQSTITIDENDADWQGSFVTGKASVGFVLRIQRSALGDQATLRSDGFGFFPTNEIPGSITLTESNFQTAIPNIPIPANATLLNSAMLLRLELNAANGQTNQSVDSTFIQGQAALITTVPGREYLNNTNRGTFVLLKSPVRPSTNEVQLVAKP